MGGRGRSSGLNTHRQRTLEDIQRQQMVSDIINDRTQKRASINGEGDGGSSSAQLFKKCACCREYTITVGTEYETCIICGWIDDPIQNKNSDSIYGKNSLSLVEARIIYQQNERNTL